MTTVLVLNGEPPPAALLHYWAGQGNLYAADGGSMCCVEHGVRPLKVVGDFDSLNRDVLPADWELIHRPDQNSTDFQKVLAVLPEVPTELVVLGGLGDRLDHTLTNLLIAGSILPETRIQFVGASETMIRVTPETPLHLDLPIGQTLSLIPLQAVQGVTTSGLKWNLTRKDMGPGGQLGQSNLVEGPVSVSVESDWVWVWVKTL